MKSLACFIVKLLDLLLPKRDIIYFHGHVGNYCGNSKYMYKYMVESYKNKKINIVPLWISKSNKDTKKIEEENGAGFIVPSQSRKDRIFLLFKLLVARYIVVTSIGDLWQYRKCLNKSNRIIIQTSNGITIKSGWFMTPLIKKPFVIQKKTQDIDFFLVSSEIERYFFSSTVLQDPRKFVITGEQRNDQFALQKKNTQLLKEELYHILEIGLEKKIAPKLILYAPSHRDAGILGKNYCTAPKFFPFKDFNSTGLIKELSEEEFQVTVKTINSTIHNVTLTNDTHQNLTNRMVSKKELIEFENVFNFPKKKFINAGYFFLDHLSNENTCFIEVPIEYIYHDDIINPRAINNSINNCNNNNSNNNISNNNSNNNKFKYILHKLNKYNNYIN